MNRFINRANTRLSLSSAAFLLIAASGVGTVLGVVRTSLINANFNGFSASAYFAAFKIPDFIFFTLATGALGVAFMPVLADKLSKGNRQQAWDFASSVLNTIAIITFFLSLISMIFARPLLHYVVARGFPPEQLDLAVSVMRIVSINPFLFSISTLLTSVQQTVGRFFFFAIAPLFYNISIIVAIVLLNKQLGVVAVGVGVVVGAVLQLLVAGVGMIGLRYRYSLKINTKDKDYRKVMSVLPARSIDQGIDYINSIFETSYASGISRVAVANYENAMLLHNAPTMLIGTAISSAAFPRFTERIAQGRSDLFKKEFLQVLRAMIWIALPVVIVCYFEREYLARLISKRENNEIALIFGALSVAIFFRTLYAIISRFFYAQKDTMTPLVVSIVTIIANIFLAYELSRPNAFGIVGLAIAQSIVATFEVIVMLIIMIIKNKRLFNMEFVRSILWIFSASGFTLMVTYLGVNLLPLNTSDRGVAIFSKVILIGLMAVTTHVFISWLLKISEAQPVVDKLKKYILRPIKIQ
jgi:putative peptidoglycan lipid II flippase